MGLTRRIHADTELLDASKATTVIDALNACLEADAVAVDAAVRDDRNISIVADERTNGFMESSAPPTWSTLIRTLADCGPTVRSSYDRKDARA